MATKPAPFDSRSVVRRNQRRAFWTDLYHNLVGRSWWRLLGIIFGVYLVVNTVFAVLYAIGGDCVTGAHRFADLFFFSVQTLSTIGYGTMAPANLYAHSLVTLQAFLGTLFLAVVTGLVFSKFARPSARVRWTNKVVFVERDGQMQMMFRMANERANQIVEAQLNLVMTRSEVTSDGERQRRFYSLDLVRDHNVIFQLSWTAIHTVTDKSPLHGLTQQEMVDCELGLVCSLIGHDETYGQTVHSRHIYNARDFVYGQRFADIIGNDDDGTRWVDYARFDDLVPMGTKSAGVD